MALRRNLELLRAHAGQRRVIAVVKADAYGHGAVAVARALVDAGAHALAVATLAEACELRAAGLAVPIVLLEGLHAPAEADEIAAHHLIPLVGALWSFEPLRAAASRAGRTLPVQLKVDSGMGRLGLLPEQLDAALEELRHSPGLELTGFASHLADAENPGSASLVRQRERFAQLLARVQAAGLHPSWIHLDSSAGILHGPTPGTTAVRPGIALYGVDPTSRGAALAPVMSLFTRVLRAADLPAGTPIGYGGDYVTPCATRILTLPIGYADGLPRAAGGRFSAAVGGVRVPLVGRVSMDLATLDAGPGATAREGDRVLLFGSDAGLTIRVEELARATGTIAYEILVRIGPRVPRAPRGSGWSGPGLGSGSGSGPAGSGGAR